MCIVIDARSARHRLKLIASAMEPFTPAGIVGAIGKAGCNVEVAVCSMLPLRFAIYQGFLSLPMVSVVLMISGWQ